VSSRRFLTEDEWVEHLATFEHTAFRLEHQREYWEPTEKATIERFLAGDPEPPDQVPALKAWFDAVAAHTSTGRRVERVRVIDDPPTGQQQWERWISRWNRAAGETIRYLSRKRSHEIGLLPAAGPADWWLIDSCRLVVMRFDDAGRRIENELITNPARVVQACAWRDLAVHHAMPDIVDVDPPR
jgi:hypothetical protein